MTEPKEIRSPFEMDDKGPKYDKDFRLVANRDEDVPDPKVLFVPEPADSFDSNQLELQLTETSVPAVKVSTPPRGKETGLPTLQPVTSAGKTKQPAEQ